MKTFFKSLISSKDTTSSKRVITLIVAIHFMIASFVLLFICAYVIFYTTKGKVDKDLLLALENILEKDFYIILSGLGFITGENLGNIFLEKEKAKVENMYNQQNNPFYGQPNLPQIKNTEGENIGTDI